MDANESDDNAIPRGPKGYFLKGLAPKSPGRPPGSKSIKDALRQYLEDHPNDFEEFVEHFVHKNRELAFQMLEGRPAQMLQGDPNAPFILNVTQYGDSKPPVQTEDIPNTTP